MRFLMPNLVAVCLFAAIVLAGASPAFADVFGRLRFTVKNADDEKPIAGAKIALHDTAGVHADVSLLTDKDGAALSQPLEIRPWGVTAESELFRPDTRQVQVVADTNTAVEVLLEPLREKVVKITGQKQLVTATQTTTASHVDQTFVQTFPTNVANPLSLGSLETANPGFVADSVNQVHARGEHTSTTIVIDGFALPGANQRRIGQVLAPAEVQSADVLTGAYAPEYGGETAAILNMNLRSGSIKPTEDLRIGAGGFSTFTGELSMSGQTGPPIDRSSDTANGAKRFGYFIDFAGRTTDNAVEPPQPDQQTAHNAGSNENLFGNFNYTPGSRDKITLTMNDDPAQSEIANRTGLPAYFASVGQGFGYAGHLSAADASAQGIVSQQVDGQDINQRDLLGPNPVAPTLLVNRSGYYAAAYAQDTWNLTSRVTANYGLRLDAYQQTENLGSSSINQSTLSPRANVAYKLAPGTVVRASYDKLFTEPPLAQGAILGQPILPQIADQYEVSLERQVAARQVVKVSEYVKRDQNQIDVGLLIPGTQIGAFTAVNFQRGCVWGLELSYDLLPARDNLGWSSFLGWTNSVARPSGLDNTGAPAPTYNDHDQRNTITTGAAYA
jgi:hypothetical protein